MSERLTLRDVSAPVAALALLMAGHPDLPAPHIDISPVFPERLRLGFHGEPFDAWLAALVVAPETVTTGTQSNGQTNVRKVTARYGGAEIELAEFTQVEQGGPR